MHIKGENLDSNGPEHICMSWITKCVQKASTTLWAKVILITAGFIGSIWFRCCNLVWLMACCCLMLTFRAGSGHLFYGPGRVRAGRFWPGSGSGRPFLASGQFGMAFFGLGPVRAADFGLFCLFLPIFAQFFS